MRKVLKYLSFAAAGFLEIFAFITPNTYIQLAIAIIFYPLLAYFAYRLFFSKKQKIPQSSFQLPTIAKPENIKTETVQAESGDVIVADIDKRAFLKLIGAAGISFFLYSIFSRKSEALFFGKALEPGITALEDSTGKKIDPAERQPTDSYLISEIDDELIAYYGFTNKEGAWFIMKEDPDNGSIRYTKGDVNFPGNWSDRESLNYDYYHNVFK